ncbi:hypothetical protein BDZ97DRAFT_1825173 [Flammula alnicola]|nr:hypothetical protein BDZ97DRAFT_1825173 [Flammula alnicola]
MISTVARRVNLTFTNFNFLILLSSLLCLRRINSSRASSEKCATVRHVSFSKSGHRHSSSAFKWAKDWRRELETGAGLFSSWDRGGTRGMRRRHSMKSCTANR